MFRLTRVTILLVVIWKFLRLILLDIMLVVLLKPVLSIYLELQSL